MGTVLGILYVWSVIKAGIPDAWGWTNADKALPYATMATIFSFIMVPAGQLQDRFGPRIVVLLGGGLAGLGCIVAGLGGESKLAYIIGFGAITGTGVGFGYSGLTPAAIKWFPSRQTGLVAGFVVAGVGLAPVPLAPLTAWMLKVFSTTAPDGTVIPGISTTMIILGVIIWIVVGALFGFIVNPPMGFVARERENPKFGKNTIQGSELSWKPMMGTLRFWLLYCMYFAGASAGLVFISVAADLGKKALGEMAFFTVVVLSLGNTLGRVVAGAVSDRIGRMWTLFTTSIAQSLVIGTLYLLSGHGGAGTVIILPVVFLIGLNYGANLALFPSICKESFGIRNFGINYGWMFTAFGAAGLIMPWLNGVIRDVSGTQDLTYILIIAMLIMASLLALVLKKMGPPTESYQ
jgi:nitrate/nitrite transporter NarK